MNKNLFFKSILGFLVSRRGYFRVIFENQTGLTTKKSDVRKNDKLCVEKHLYCFKFFKKFLLLLFVS